MKENRYFLLMLVFVIISWIITPFLVFWNFNDMTSRGQFGDLYGSINSLFSGLALAGIIYSIILQQNQLKMQSEELTLQRKELELQREEMRASRTELKNQVGMQHALILATIAQVNVAAVNAEIEADKLDAERYKESGTIVKYVEKIKKAATGLSDLAIKLKYETPDV